MHKWIPNIINNLKTCDWIECVFQVGSSLVKTDAKDVNILIVTTYGEVIEHYDEVVEKSLIMINTASLRDDVIRLELNSNILDIAFTRKEKLTSLIKGEIIDCGYNERAIPWGVKSWIPEALLSDIKISHVLYDPARISKEIYSLLDVYPEVFRKQLIRRCLNEIQHKFRAYMKTSPSSLEYFLLLADIVAALIRYAFACDRIFLKGFHRLEEQCEELSDNSKRIIFLANSLHENDKPYLEKQLSKLLQIKI